MLNKPLLIFTFWNGKKIWTVNLSLIKSWIGHNFRSMESTQKVAWDKILTNRQRCCSVYGRDEQFRIRNIYHKILLIWKKYWISNILLFQGIIFNNENQLKTYKMTNGRLEVRIFFLFKRTISLPVKVIRPMLILLNCSLKHLKRRWYT